MMLASAATSLAIRSVLDAPDSNFVALARAAGLRPDRDFRNAMLRDVDFAGSDLSGFDFSGAQIIGCRLTGCRLSDAIFDDTKFSLTDLSRATDWSERNVQAPIVYRRWDPDGEKPLVSRNVVGKLIALDEQIAIVDIGSGLCRRFHIGLLNPVLENRKIAPGDTVALPEHIVDQAPAYFYDPEELPAPLDFDAIVAAMESGEIVRGMIQRPIKAGYLVNIGGFSAFLPGSQVDRSPVASISPLLDDAQPFIIVQVGARYQTDIIVSRKAAIEKAEEDVITARLQQLSAGDIEYGTVAWVVDYGVLVDLDGLPGFVHKSSMPPQLQENFAEVYAAGDAIKVRIKRINFDTRKINLSVKEFYPDPWTNMGESVRVGARFRAKISRLAHFGVFVSIAPGIDALLHSSRLSWPHPVPAGQKMRAGSGNEIDVEILDIDLAKHRISVRRAGPAADAVEDFLAFYPVASSINATVIRAADGEAIVDLRDGLEGIASTEAMDLTPMGDSHRFLVLGRDEDGRRVALRAVPPYPA